MRTLTVDLGVRSYPVFVGPGLLNRKDLFTQYIRGSQVLVVSNDTVGPLYLQQVVDRLADKKVDQCILPDGEQFKTLDTLNVIFDKLLCSGHQRSTTLIALGGGVVGDITGFAAACYQRGVDFIQVPTTLLAQVDSSVGGKTAVNHQLGKNMIGAFHQPQAVIADTDTLTTLPDREFRSGLAEVIKYGLMADATFFTWLQDNMNGLLERHSDLLVEAIIRSCRAKADIVSADEREGGRRALLNLGHTFGHAIETAQNYRAWLHGEAVAAGMVMAAQFSQALGWLKPTEVESIATLIARAGLPTAPPAGIPVEQFLSLMAVDKKAQNGVLRLVLLRGIGDGRVTADYDPDLLRATLAQLVS